MPARDGLVPIPPKRLLKYIGILSFSLPLILIIGTVIGSECDLILHSVSAYYHSVMGDFFVGALCAISFCMYAYEGYDSTDNIMSSIAGVALLGVAFFPTTVCGQIENCLDGNAESNLIGNIHYVSAAIVFLILAFFCLVQFVKGDKPFRKAKQKRNLIYRICGGLILFSILAIVVYSFYLKKQFPNLINFSLVFWFEALALMSFSVAWLIKGEVMLRDPV